MESCRRHVRKKMVSNAVSSIVRGCSGMKQLRDVAQMRFKFDRELLSCVGEFHHGNRINSETVAAA